MESGIKADRSVPRGMNQHTPVHHVLRVERDGNNCKSPHYRRMPTNTEKQQTIKQLAPHTAPDRMPLGDRQASAEYIDKPAYY